MLLLVLQQDGLGISLPSLHALPLPILTGPQASHEPPAQAQQLCKLHSPSPHFPLCNCPRPGAPKLLALFGHSFRHHTPLHQGDCRLLTIWGEDVLIHGLG